jgi:hypothetical protein
MRNLILILITILLFCGIAEAGRVDQCLWVWSTSTQNQTEDVPDVLWCNFDGRGFRSMGTSSAMHLGGANTITLTWDTVKPDGSTTIGSLHGDITDTTVICSNAVATQDLNFHGSANGQHFDAGGAYYYEIADLADADVDTVSVTPIEHLRLTVTEDNTGVGCLVVWVTVRWD